MKSLPLAFLKISNLFWVVISLIFQHLNVMDIRILWIQWLTFNLINLRKICKSLTQMQHKKILNKIHLTRFWRFCVSILHWKNKILWFSNLKTIISCFLVKKWKSSGTAFSTIFSVIVFTHASAGWLPIQKPKFVKFVKISLI